MIYLAAFASTLSLLLLACLVYLAQRFSEERARMLKAFNEERGIWIRERRDLNNRIQVPESAPFMPTDGPSEDDLPRLPEFAVDEDELEQARRHLEEVGYESGPAA